MYFWTFLNAPNRKFSTPKIDNVPRSVNNFRIEDFKGFWEIFGPNWSPYVAEYAVCNVVSRF